MACGASMNKGDIIRMPSGRFARYEGGVLGQGAEFVYLDANGNPVKNPSDTRFYDSFCIRNMTLLRNLQPVAAGEWDRS